ncbi:MULTISPECIES: sensor histidine kinase [Amycolatopsis]|uniref:histidine kinase n=2 Tax=Amycolatopsis TaxID=1813 RepID=A0A1I3JWP2_9PSEU|nr:histidine kinase [Amycolatopsis sacchari]SFI64500.1 Histidine kinase [Amycolatopsis sacchari]
MDEEARLYWYTDRLLRPFAIAALVLVAALQFAAHPVTWRPLAIALLACCAAGEAAGLVPGDRLAPGGRLAFGVSYSVLSGMLLPLAQSTVAPAFAFLASAQAGQKLPARTAVCVATGGAVTTAVSLWLVDRLAPGSIDWPWWLGLTVVTPVFLGIARRNGLRAAEAERREATLRERGRIAREIHDVLGHSLSGIALQLDLADALHGKGRADEANEAVRRARALAVSSISETRRAIEALHEDALPLEQSLELLAGSESVPLEITGEPAPVSSEAAHALLRAAQEALTNAAKHAPGARRAVKLAFTRDSVALTVVNDRAPGGAVRRDDGGGMGLVGMRERIALLRGTLRAGPDAETGGWRVAVEVPR